jgi:hypothetical protein
MTYIAPVAERLAGFSAADLTWVLVIVGVGLVIGKRDPIPFCISESEFAKTLSRGAGPELAHLELKARPIDAYIPLRRDEVQRI